MGGSNLAGNGDFADESNFAECSDAAEEVCDSTNKNNSGLNKDQRYKGSDATATTATHHQIKSAGDIDPPKWTQVPLYKPACMHGCRQCDNFAGPWVP